MTKILGNSYLTLPPSFYAHATAATFPQTRLLLFNHPLALELGWADLLQTPSEELAQYLSGQIFFTASTSPIALAYAGHQFGYFVPMLGDGRAMLLGTITDPDKKEQDIVLKGAGQTKFSRNGDGRCPLKAALREYLISEAIHALNISSTRSLAVVLTGEKIFREEGAIPGAVITRVATTHIRIGTFEYFAYQRDYSSIKILSDYCIKRYYPNLLGVSPPQRYLELFKVVAERTLSLVAKWMRVGFIHGVMNTDNTSIAGETIDYGPCAFLDAYKSDQVFSSIDAIGRYAYANQGQIALWNLSSLASTLLPLIDHDQKRATCLLQDELARCCALFEEFWLREMCAKLGIFSPIKSDGVLVSEFLSLLQEHQLDFNNSFRMLFAHAPSSKEHNCNDNKNKIEDKILINPPRFISIDFIEKWKRRLSEQAKPWKEVEKLMNDNNPRVIPRNHVVEKSISLAIEGDLYLFQRLNKILSTPYSCSLEQDNTLSEEDNIFFQPPSNQQRVYKTFCGT